MTNKEFTKQMAAATGLSSIEIAELQSACTRMIVEQVAQGNSVVFSGFGAFEQKEKAERKIFNPNTKEFKTVPARTTLGFRPANTFKDKLNG